MSDRTIPLEPIAFIDEIMNLMVKNNMIKYFEISDLAKQSFGATLAKWIKIDGKMTEDQRDNAVKHTMAFIIGCYWGPKR